MSTGELWHRLATRSRSNLYFALIFLSAAERDAFRDVYRFLRAADDEADSGLPAAESRARLAAWRAELAAIYDGRATHPAARRLARTVARFHLLRAHFETLMDALEADVGARRLATWPELEGWCAAMSATLGYLCLELLACDTPAARAYARDVGVALQLAHIVRDVADDAARGRIYLPAAELAAEGVGAADILAGRWSPGFARVCAAQAARTRALIARGRAGLGPRERRRLLVPEMWADVYLALLDELEGHRFDVFTRRPYLRRRTKLGIACRRWLRQAVARRIFPYTS